MRSSFLPLLLTILFFSCTSRISSTDDSVAAGLREVFNEPPQSAKPLVWWHWMNGNISKDGIRKDIEWMHRVGIGGFHVFDANFDTPQIVEKRLAYMSEDWKDAFRSAVSLADSLGFDVGIASSPGFSHTGGPWVRPEDAMKKLVWREMLLEGGKHFHGKLPGPFSTSGRFQDIPLTRQGVVADKTAESYYADIAVIAVELGDSVRLMDELGATVSCSGGDTFTLKQLNNDSYADYGRLDAGADGFAWIQYSFPGPRTFRALTVTNPNPRQRGHSVAEYCEDSLQVSDDGVNFRTVFGIPVGSCEAQTISFEPLTARYFRLKHRNPKAYYHYSMPKRDPDPEFSLVPQFRLYTENRINHAEEKAAFAASHDLHDYSTPEGYGGTGKVVVLTDAFRDGVLDWDVPEGRWAVYRFGASLTGKKNHPASPEATGLEVDKLDPDAMCTYLRHYLDMYRDASGNMLGARGIRHLMVDSYESGAQNWTSRMREEFLKRRGYDMTLWMPVLAGVIVGDAAKSESFLKDFRTTIGELFSENFARITDVVRGEYGMEGCFIESHENGRVFVMDGMSVKKTALYPMSACWVPGKVGAKDRVFEGMADIRESASVAHIYGQNLVAAESLTSIGLARQAYSYHPENLKHTADLELSCGVNRFVIHDSAHQPRDDKFPGLGLGVYGQWFNRHECWAEQAGAWISYLARSCAMLQQGRDVADILWLYGEDTNITAHYSHGEPSVPAGFRYDFVNPEAFLDKIMQKGKTLAAESGSTYRVLCLDESASLLPEEALEKIEAIRKAGIPVVTPGAGLEKACRRLSKDFAAPDSLVYVHRTMPGADVYWISNPSSSVVKCEASFRVCGRAAEIWNAETGEMKPVSFRFSRGRTVVPLELAPDDAVFVVFVNPAEKGRKVPAPDLLEIAPVSGPWTVSFQPGRGAQDSIAMDKLEPLNENESEGVRYFSGTATYKTHFRADTLASTVLSLGKVCNIAEVTVNGSPVATLWRAPFRVDVSPYVVPGDNVLEVRVTNLWVNRLIGDSREGAAPLTYTPVKFYKADDPLLPSGLIGPVELLTYGFHF